MVWLNDVMQKRPHDRFLPEILTLDPVKDHKRIVHLDVCFEFPWDTTRSLEMALFRTFGVPSIAERLASTEEFFKAPQKRYDDTDILISTMLEDGYDSPTGTAALRRMNQIHGRFQISNEDLLYVLSTFIYEPVRWIEKFGWRPMVEQERLATFYCWREIGKRMGIKAIPETYEGLEAFNISYETEQFRRSEPTVRIGIATRDMFLGWFPRPVRGFGALAIYSLLDDQMLDAFGFPEPPRAVKRMVDGTLKARARALRWLPPRRRARRRTQMKHRTYKQGYEIESIGPEAR